jgi:hypothetical protein
MYNSSYFINNYEVTGDVVRRRPISRQESQFEKHNTLTQCIKHFTGADLRTITNIHDHFICIDQGESNETRCCCSQDEPDGLHCYVIKHLETNLTFIVGSVCFKNLFTNVEPEQFNKFFQQTCKYCKEKVKKHCPKRPNFCNQKCVKKHAEEEEIKRQLLREQELKKKWDEEAPLRQAEAERKKKEWEDGAEQRKLDYENKTQKLKEQKEEYINQQKLKNKKPIYLKCEECDKPKKTDSQQKWPLCYDCYNKSSDED